MSNAPQDIIRTALDILTGPDREVELVIANSDAKYNGTPTWTRYGTLTGMGSMGDDATLTIDQYRASRDGNVIANRTLVGVHEIISITRA